MNIRYISAETDLSDISLVDWDARVGKSSVDVYFVEGYIHTYDTSLGSKGNCYWCCDEGATPSFRNLYPFLGRPVDWSIKVAERNSYKRDAVDKGVICHIFRNDKMFYEIVFGREIWEASLAAQKALIELQEHPINFFSKRWKDQLIERKILWYYQVAVIKSIDESRGEIFVVPHEKDSFDCHHSSMMAMEEKEWVEEYGKGLHLKYLDSRIWWFVK